MKFRRKAVEGNAENHETREEMRELAEALSLYRSAMHHVAERHAARPWIAEPHPTRTFRLGLLLAPAVAAAVAAGILIPEYSQHHRPGGTSHTIVKEAPNQPAPGETRASMDADTALMNQIDSEVSEDVPDALQPLADLTEGSTTNISGTEKKSVTQE